MSVFLSLALSFRRTKMQCANTLHSLTYIHTYIQAMVAEMVYTGLSKKESLELSFELGKSGEIPQTGRQRIPDRWSDESESALTKRFRFTFRDFQKRSLA